MKAFVIGVAVMILVSAGAALMLETVDMSAQEVYRSPSSVRL